MNEILPATTADEIIVTRAVQEHRTILTQDLDLSAIIALAGKNAPSLITLRLASSRIEYVNSVLQKVLPAIEQDVLAGMIVTVEDQRIRRRALPIC